MSNCAVSIASENDTQKYVLRSGAWSLPKVQCVSQAAKTSFLNCEQNKQVGGEDTFSDKRMGRPPVSYTAIQLLYGSMTTSANDSL